MQLWHNPKIAHLALILRLTSEKHNNYIRQ